MIININGDKHPIKPDSEVALLDCNLAKNMKVIQKAKLASRITADINFHTSQLLSVTLTIKDKHFHNLKIDVQYEMMKFNITKYCNAKHLHFYICTEYTVQAVWHGHGLVWGKATDILKFVNWYKRNHGMIHTVRYDNLLSDFKIFNKIYSFDRYYRYMHKDLEVYGKPVIRDNL